MNYPLRPRDEYGVEHVLASYMVPGDILSTRWITGQHRHMWKVYGVRLWWPMLSPDRELKERLALWIGAHKVELSRHGLDLEVYAR